jgi:pimeloyl-ACP methyl ester carboxylesterase
MDEPTRLLPPLIPLPNGGWQTSTLLTPEAFRIRGLALLPSNSIVPIIVVPGIMGTNLRAKASPRTDGDVNQRIQPGEPAWRPPNTMPGGLWDAFSWDRLKPRERQLLLDPDTLEVDDDGPPHVPHGDGRLHIHPDLARQRWWGELHADSYGGLLCALETRLNRTFYPGPNDERRVQPHWKDVMACDPKIWGFAGMKPLTETDLEKHARHHYPVYGAGYHWLRSCLEASGRLEERIEQIIAYWQAMKRECTHVILVTHSMGGLVARACAKRIPDKIAGVIHGVMPALGAPAAYRRMACGTETQDIADKFGAMILGATTHDTTPVLATSPGPLELLPNQLYPRPWLYVSVVQPSSVAAIGDRPLDYLRLPNEIASNPYDLYRDTRRWYRLVDPELADPAGKFARKNRTGGVKKAIQDAIDEAEQFHTTHLGDYYHPNTYAFYGSDPEQLAFGQVRWLGRKQAATPTVLTTANVTAGKFAGNDPDGGRRIDIGAGCTVLFRPAPPDSRGDRTVPHQSGAGPAGKIQHLFETRGYDHQGSYNNEDMLKLTLRLIVRIVQGLPG